MVYSKGRHRNSKRSFRLGRSGTDDGLDRGKKGSKPVERKKSNRGLSGRLAMFERQDSLKKFQISRSRWKEPKKSQKVFKAKSGRVHPEPPPLPKDTQFGKAKSGRVHPEPPPLPKAKKTPPPLPPRLPKVPNRRPRQLKSVLLKQSPLLEAEKTSETKNSITCIEKKQQNKAPSISKRSRKFGLGKTPIGKDSKSENDLADDTLKSKKSAVKKSKSAGVLGRGDQIGRQESLRKFQISRKPNNPKLEKKKRNLKKAAQIKKLNTAAMFEKKEQEIPENLQTGSRPKRGQRGRKIDELLLKLGGSQSIPIPGKRPPALPYRPQSAPGPSKKRFALGETAGGTMGFRLPMGDASRKARPISTNQEFASTESPKMDKAVVAKGARKRRKHKKKAALQGL